MVGRHFDKTQNVDQFFEHSRFLYNNNIFFWDFWICDIFKQSYLPPSPPNKFFKRCS